ncbi:LOW QUALITY PROTEIN: myb-like protein X [Vespula maculifrons]|uniref:Myb-like protein X n=1 Tax=Vespula maculifrons TaxID=7453 RepID=A0ABD2CZ69_VESMC
MNLNSSIDTSYSAVERAEYDVFESKQTKNRKKKFILALITNVLEIDVVLFYYAAIEWWYGARESSLQRIDKEAASDIIDCVGKGFSKERPTVHTDHGSKLNFCSNEGTFLRRKVSFLADSLWILFFCNFRRIQCSREGQIKINNNVDQNYIYRNNIYFNTEIRDDKENLRAINSDSEKEVLRINIEEEEEEDEDEEGDTGDEVVEENDIQSRNDYENGSFNHGLKIELRIIEFELRQV